MSDLFFNLVVEPIRAFLGLVLEVCMHPLKMFPDVILIGTGFLCTPLAVGLFFSGAFARAVGLTVYIYVVAQYYRSRVTEFELFKVPQGL